MQKHSPIYSTNIYCILILYQVQLQAENKYKDEGTSPYAHGANSPVGKKKNSKQASYSSVMLNEGVGIWDESEKIGIFVYSFFCVLNIKNFTFFLFFYTSPN